MYIKKNNKINKESIIYFLVVIGVINFISYIFYLNEYKYLPPPFVFDKNNTFMDFYNPAYEVINGTFYTLYKSIYPPINYYILYFFSFVMNIESVTDAFGLRLINNKTTWGIISFYVMTIICIFNLGEWRKISNEYSIKILIIALISLPVLFAIERGNLIFLALLFLALYLHVESIILRIILLAFLINLKPYFAIFLLPYLNIHKFEKNFVIGTITVTVFLFYLTSFGTDTNIKNYINTMLYFSGGQNLSPFGVLSLPNSIGAFLMPKWAIAQLWYYPVKILAIITPLIMFFCIIFIKNTFKNQIISCSILITNFSIVTSGYIYIIYLILIPYLFTNKKLHHRYLTIIVFIFCIPLDWITVSKVELGQMYSYLGEQLLNARSYNVGLGSILRPILNYTLMLMFIYDSIRRSRSNYNGFEDEE